MKIIAVIFLAILLIPQSQPECAHEWIREEIDLQHCEPYDITLDSLQYRIYPPCKIVMCICPETEVSFDCSPKADTVLISTP